jgi:hypothetical protein
MAHNASVWQGPMLGLSPRKRGDVGAAAHQRDDGAAALQRRGGGSDESGSSSEVGRCSATCTRKWGGGAMRWVVHGGHDRSRIGEHDGDSLARTGGSDGGPDAREGTPLYSRAVRKEDGMAHA